MKYTFKQLDLMREAIKNLYKGGCSEDLCADDVELMLQTHFTNGTTPEDFAKELEADNKREIEEDYLETNKLIDKLTK